jgi:UDP-N-acetylglucosamine--N-acetylmuramyl-(pentapeptide) pyrophosphoryl-undecaprenol N-acetylglucosamine transferase
LKENKYRFLFAGGGTGGHLFPAVAVAENIRKFKPEADILFIGSKSKIESKVVPSLGFKFVSINVKGLSRRLDLQNLLFPFRLFYSVMQSLFSNMKFKPKVAIGSGGYVAGPAIWSASVMGAKVILLEQNNFPGVTTRMLEKYADEIHISFEESKKYLRSSKKIFVTGNPVRDNLKLISKEEASIKFKLDDKKKTVLIIGGSLGAGSLNEAVESALPLLTEREVQIIWQTGKIYFDKYKKYQSEKIRINSFIDDMNAAYSASDILIARAGATTIAEITALGIASILVPSPNVASNHQFYNACSLTDHGAALLIEDKEVRSRLAATILDLIYDDGKIKKLKDNSKALGKPDAAEIIAKRAIKLAEST